VDSPFAEFLSKNGRLLLLFLELTCNTEQAVDKLIGVIGRAALEVVPLLSAQQIAGPKQLRNSVMSRVRTTATGGCFSSGTQIAC
jgi:hypothetical protein